MLTHLPQTDANKGRLFVAGFDNGIVRFCQVNSEGVEIMKAFKAHDESIIGVKFSADLKMCVTASTGGEIFFFEMDGHKDTQKYDPMCCLKLPDDSKINDFSWNTDDKSLVFGCKNGNVYQIRRPEAKDVDNADSYEWVNPDISTWTIKIMEF